MPIRRACVATSRVLLSGTALPPEHTESQSGTLGSTWTDAAKMPDLFSGMWMTFSGMVEDDAI